MLHYYRIVPIGYAPDGGLYVPDKIPSLSKEALEIHWSRLTYVGIAKEICSLFIAKEEIDREELHNLIEQARKFYSNMFSSII